MNLTHCPKIHAEPQLPGALDALGLRKVLIHLFIEII